MACLNRKVILCVDGSNSSKLTSDFYIESIANKNDEVFIVSVFDPPSLGMILAYSGPFVIPEDYEERLSKEVELQKKVLYEYKNSIQEHENCNKLGLDLKCKLINPHEMEVGPTILCFAKEVDADFIIVGSRGANFFKRAFTGSISTYLTHNSKIMPVIVGPRPNKCRKE